ncbi:hypothetical protein [Pseudoalteromonas mariniglutinosa]|uniref:hypothetical protein n=1 Tax=Pseudoalteromonas mariniglutinosa TaxID=206042 RepID=UPI003850D222
MFEAHGNWRYFIEPPTIYIEISGSFNKEAVTSFIAEVGKEMALLPANSVHYAIVNLTHFELVTADSINVAKTYFHAVKDRGYQRVDYIKPNIVVEHLLTMIWQGSGMDVQFHADAESYFTLHPEHSHLRKWLK